MDSDRDRRGERAPGPGKGRAGESGRSDRFRRTPGARSWLWPTLLALAVTTGSLASLALPAVLARAVDQALSDGTGTGFLPLAAVLVLLTSAEATAQYAGPRATADETARLRRAMVRRVMAAGAFPPGRTAPGDLVARLTGSGAEAALATQAVVYAVAQLLMAVGAVVALGLLAPELAAAFLVTAPAGYVLVRRHLRRTTQQGAGYQRAQGEVAARLVDALTGSRTIAAAGTVDQEIERVMGPVPELSRCGRALWDSQRRVAWATGLLAPATQITVLAIAGYELSVGRLSAGGLIAALGYATIGLGGFGTAQSLLDYARARAGRDRVAEVLATPVQPPGTRDLPPGPGLLELRGVTVHRSGRAVLDGLDLTLPAGSFVALVGRSGAGTSLLTAVAGGLLVPDTGLALLDGVPMDDIRPDRLRTAVAFAFADPALTGDTVHDAVALAAGPVAADRVRTAARTAQADTFVSRLPETYLTPLSEAPLSGGERQRLGLARALARDSRLLVLDDATSSLDTTTEALVLGAMAVTHRDRTRLMVTRRASTAARADAVAWLDEGRIRAFAHHDELWEIPAYRSVFRDGDD
ncbi:ABC transporter ATP-binding protein [Streptomyces sp. NPDC015684]|uniref:ABC transporter ATP-binding protein n=1 Tax=Streptomyces sp. NPDC015684 TaxID=3364963 RepID=UPI0036F51638